MFGLKVISLIATATAILADPPSDDHHAQRNLPSGVGYKCGHTAAVAHIPLIREWPCNEGNLLVSNTSIGVVQLLHMRTIWKLNSIRCSHRVHVTQRYCSYSGYPAKKLNPANAEEPYYVTISQERCREMIATKTWVDPDGLAHDLKESHITVIKGENLNKEGWCTTRSSDFTTKEHQIEMRKMRIEASMDDSGKVMTSMAEDDTPLSFVTETSFSDGQGRSYILPASYSENITLVELASVPMRKLIYSDGGQVLFAPERSSAFLAGKNITVLGQDVTETQVPRLYIRTDHHITKVTSPDPSDFATLDLVLTDVTSLQTKLTNILGATIQWQNNQICNLAKTTQSQLAHVKTIPGSLLAMTLLGTEGYTAQVVGDAIAIAKCARFEWVVRDANVCYQRVPIYYSAHKLKGFLDAYSMDIWATSNEVDCDDISIPVISFRGKLMSMRPVLQEVSQTWNRTVTGHQVIIPSFISATHLYTKEQLESLQYSSSYRERYDRAIHLMVERVSRAQNLERLGEMSGGLLDDITWALHGVGLSGYGRWIVYSIVFTGIAVPAMLMYFIVIKVYRALKRINTLITYITTRFTLPERERPVSPLPEQVVLVTNSPDRDPSPRSQDMRRTTVSPTFVKMVASRRRDESN
nr:MAG: glycoprotein [Mononegavirales sp.]